MNLTYQEVKGSCGNSVTAYIEHKPEKATNWWQSPSQYLCLCMSLSSVNNSLTPIAAPVLLGAGPSAGVIDLPNTTILKKTDLPSEKPSAVSSSSAKSDGSWTPLPVGLSTGWILCRQPQLLWTHECSGPVMARRCCCALVVHPDLWIVQTLHPFSHHGTLRRGEGMCQVHLSKFIMPKRQKVKETRLIQP